MKTLGNSTVSRARRYGMVPTALAGLLSGPRVTRTGPDNERDLEAHAEAAMVRAAALLEQREGGGLEPERQ
jgi:hypothetical protein